MCCSEELRLVIKKLNATHKSTASNSAFAERVSATCHLLLILKSCNRLLIFRTEKSDLAFTSHVSFVKLLPDHDLTRNIDGAFSEFIHMPKVIEQIGYFT